MDYNVNKMLENASQIKVRRNRIVLIKIYLKDMNRIHRSDVVARDLIS